MMQEEKLTGLLEEIKKGNDKQILYARMQCIFSVIAALCCLIVLIVGLKILPDLQTAVAQAETVLTNLESVTTELAKTDLGNMVENVDSLVKNVDSLIQDVGKLVHTSQDGVEQTMGKIDAIDFETLNKAIENLSKVIEPIAKFFNVFKS